MKLVMTLLVRNEADLIPTNLDYHLAQGVDHVIVTDHDSTDGTGEILKRYERMGVATLLHEPGDEHHQSRRVTRMAQLALTEHRADWVFHNDADEFWWPLAGSLRDVFVAIPPEYGQIVVTRYNFLPRPDGSERFYSRLVYRERESLNPSGRPLEPKVAHRPHPDVVVAPGNHWISGADLRPVAIPGLLAIFHYPMRSYDQFERKVVQVGIGYEKLDYRSPEVGRDQLKLLQVHRQGGLREYYDSLRLEDGAVEAGLGDGRIVLDRRLERFIDDHGPAERRRDLPDGPAARAVFTQSLQATAEVESAAAARAQAESALAHTRAELDDTRAELDQFRARLTQAERELASLRTVTGSIANVARAAGGGRLLRRSAKYKRRSVD